MARIYVYPAGVRFPHRSNPPLAGAINSYPVLLANEASWNSRTQGRPFVTSASSLGIKPQIEKPNGRKVLCTTHTPVRLLLAPFQGIRGVEECDYMCLSK